MIGRKLYFDILTGEVILHIDEKIGQFVVETTKEQDFAMYDILAARNPEQVDFVQLEFGENRGDFEKASGFRIDLETNEVLFEFPEYVRPHTQIIESLQSEVLTLTERNQFLETQNTELMLGLAEMAEAQETENTQTQLALAELAELSAGGGV
ncbi:hypothetical protein VQL36_05575 [Chengkuizengella sp. SCS-71B]|uniref:hypothetical protein n=1 Tax=Chengkuizengella sp. SCS-71B TaxID=3115290 RepID=UPI0032C21634